MNSTDGSGVGKDRRRAARQALVTKALVVREREGGPPQRAMLADISLLGLGFDFSQPIEVGSRCRVRVEAGPMRLSATVNVVSCRKHGDGYRVGCQFVMNELDRPDRREPAASETRPKPLALPRNASRDLVPQPAAR